MTGILRFLQVFALGTWVGGIIFLSFVVAPAAFATLASRDQAGALVGRILAQLHWMGIGAGIVYLLATILEKHSLAALIRPAALAVILMVALTFVSQRYVSPPMARLRVQMVSVDATPRDNPLRVEFDQLHRASVRLEGSVLLLGLAALFFTTKEKMP